MPFPQQFLLDIEHPHDQLLDNFEVGANGELLAALKTMEVGFHGLWLHGVRGCGRTHLLRGACVEAQRMALRAAYLPAGCLVDRPDALHTQLMGLTGEFDVVAIDDAGALVGTLELEELLMAAYQHLVDRGGRLLIADTGPAGNREFALPDLASRLRSLQHFQVQPLDDAGKAALLRSRAEHRGYQLTDAVLEYWLARAPRGIAGLLADLDVLDRASLQQQRRVTVPLLKQTLGY